MRTEDLEALAALADGRLEEPERARFLARVERDEALYELYVETLRDVDASGSEAVSPESSGAGIPTSVSAREDVPSSSVEVVSFPQRRMARFRSMAAAALVIVAIGAGLWFNLQPTHDRTGPLAAAAGRSGALPSGWDRHDWSVTRGGGVTDPTRIALRAGVLAIDLSAAAAAGDEPAARAAITGLRSLLQDVPLAQPALLVLADAAVAPAVSQDTATRIEESVAAVADGDAYRLGRWVEAVRLLALARIPAQIDDLGGMPLPAELSESLMPTLRERLDALPESADRLADSAAALTAAIREF